MKIKYPRTFHIPQSLGVSSDDKVIPSLNIFNGKKIVITEKMDGENTTATRDYIHARSVDSAYHPSRDMVKRIWSEIRHEIPEGFRICGENLYAKHSITYDNLKSYFYCFNIWDENNTCLSWDETEEFCELLGIETVPVLYCGEFSEQVIEDTIKSLCLDKQEGFVIRVSNSFQYEDFNKNVAKWVRKGHVQTSEHWMNQEIVKNNLKGAKKPFLFS